MQGLNFSFIIPQSLAGMALPGQWRPLEEDLAFLQTEKIGAIISLTGTSLNRDLLAQYEMMYLHIPIIDFSPPTIEQIEEFVSFVDTVVKQEKAVVVHCHAGMGRTGTMLACYLVKRGESAIDSIHRIRTLRPGSIETGSQENVIFEYASEKKQENNHA